MNTLYVRTPVRGRMTLGGNSLDLIPMLKHSTPPSPDTLFGPTPYAAHDLPSQIREHIADTPRATNVLVLREWILNTLVKFNHCCPSAILTLHDSLRVLTAGRAPCKKEKQDWIYTQ